MNERTSERTATADAVARVHVGAWSACGHAGAIVAVRLAVRRRTGSILPVRSLHALFVRTTFFGFARYATVRMRKLRARKIVDRSGPQ
jgi:hypothetical protein